MDKKKKLNNLINNPKINQTWVVGVLDKVYNKRPASKKKGTRNVYLGIVGRRYKSKANKVDAPSIFNKLNEKMKFSDVFKKDKEGYVKVMKQALRFYKNPLVQEKRLQNGLAGMMRGAFVKQSRITKNAPSTLAQKVNNNYGIDTGQTFKLIEAKRVK